MSRVNRPLVAVWGAIALALTAHVACATPALVPGATTRGGSSKIVVIKKNTRHLNVYENDTIVFKYGAKQFTITFDGNKTSYDLSTLAPAGMIPPHKITVYVAPNPTQHEQGIP